VLYDRAKGSKLASQQVSESAVRDLLPKFQLVDEFAWSLSSQALFYKWHHGEQDIYLSSLAGDHVSVLAHGAEFSNLILFPYKLDRPTVEKPEA